MKAIFISKLLSNFALTTIIVICGCNPRDKDIALSVAGGNTAFSYPYAAAVVPTIDGDGKIVAIDVTTGSIKTLSGKGLKYNSVQAIPNSGGKFLVTVLHSGGSAVLTFDVAINQRSILFRSTERMRAPFMIGGVPCALAPQAQTTKQSLDFLVVCADESLIERPIIIPSYESFLFADGVALFLWNGYETTVHSLKIVNGKLALTTVELRDINFLNLLGIVDGAPYLYRDTSGHGIEVFRLESGKLVAVDGQIPADLTKSDTEGPKRFFLEQFDRFLVTRDNEADLTLEGELWSNGEKQHEFSFSVR